MFYRMNSLLKTLCCFICFNRYFTLSNNFTSIQNFINIMDCYSMF